MVFVVDDLVAWLTGLLADAGRKRLTSIVLGTDQERALRVAVDAAIRATGAELCPDDAGRAENVVLVIGQVFSEQVPGDLPAGQSTLLESLQTGVARQLAVLADPGMTDGGPSSADLLGFPAEELAESLASHLVRQIMVHGASGGPLEPLAAQLNHDITHVILGRLNSQVRKALTVLDALPRPRRPAPYLATVREIWSWTQELHGRDDSLNELISFALGDEGYRLLEGPQYAGKTALLAELVAARLPPQVDVISFFVSRIMTQADSYEFLAAVVPQLAEVLDVPVGEAGVVAFHSLWQQASDRAWRLDRHLLLVVDGLDEDLIPHGARSIASLLPATVAGRSKDLGCAHVLVSNRTDSPLPGDLPIGHPLGKLRPETLAPYPGNENYADLARQEINGLKALGGDAQELLGALAAAGGGLAVPDLQHLAGLSGQRVRDLMRRAQRSLRQVGPPESERYAFADAFRREMLSDRDLPIARYRAAIDTWAVDWRSRGWRARPGDDSGVPRYLLEAYPDTLHDAARRAGLVSDPGWVAAAIAQLGVDVVLAELRKSVAAAPGFGGPAAMLAVVRGQAAVLRLPELETGQLLRQLCLQATELDEVKLASDIRSRLSPYPGMVPQWSTRRPYRALIAEVNPQAGWVNAVALARDGRVVAGADDGGVWIWDPSTPTAGSLTLGRHDGPVRALAVGMDGRVVSGGHDRRVLMWDPDRIDAGPIELGRHDGAVRAVAFLGRDHVVSGGDDWLIRIWALDGSSDGSTVLGRHAGVVRGVAVSRRGHVASGGDDGRVCLWDPQAPGTVLAKTESLGGRVMTVAVASDNSVVAAGTDGVLYRWYHEFSDTQAAPGLAVRSGGQLAEFGSHHNVVRAVSVVRGGAGEGLVISGGDDGCVRSWQVRGRGVERADLGRHDGAVRAVWTGEDRVVSGGRDQRVRVWDLGEPNLAVPERSKVWAGRVFALCVCPDGGVIGGGADGKLWWWEPGHGAGPVELGRHDSPVTAVSVLPGSLLVSCAADGRLHVWDRAVPGELLGVPGSHDGAVLTYAAGLGVISGGYDGRVLLWEVAGSARPELLGAHSSPVSAITVLRDGSVATGGIAGDIVIRRGRYSGGEDIEIGSVGARLNALAALPGRIVAGGDDGCIWIWDLHRRSAESVTAHASSWLTSLASLGNHLISAGTDGQMIAWKSGPSGLIPVSKISCKVSMLASGMTSDGRDCLAVGHPDSGISYWLSSPPG